MKFRIRMACMCLAAVLCGCRSLPALHYYALDAVSAGSTSASSSALLIHVRHVGLPHEMDHLGLTHHVGPTQLVISDYDQWTAPLSVLIQGTLTRDLGARFGYEHLVAADALPVAATQTTLDLDFVSLSADETCGITAQVNWTTTAPGHAARRGSARLGASGTGCPAGLPAALSSALGELADQLVVALTAS
jgi:uncharacterized lipoprotein YmbA